MNLDTLPWNRLLNSIHSRQVIPVIGPGLVTVEQDGAQIPLIKWLVPEFAQSLGITVTPEMTLNQAACLHIANGGARNDIYEELRDLIQKHANIPVPCGLADLAAIRDFDLFITSTFDPFLGKALERFRPGWNARSGMAAFHPQRPVDLPEPLPNTFAYHVLGSVDTYPDFAVWEEDYMEFLCGMLEAPKDTRRVLFGELRRRSLLLIGAPFGDWIVRLFLRVAKQGRLSELPTTNINYLADTQESMGEPMVFYFDHVIGRPQILPVEPVDFVKELRRRWEEKFGYSTTDDLLASIPDDMQRGSVFISYSRDDLDSAVRLATGLKAAGIPVWLDKKRLQAGGDWEIALQRAVKSRAALFFSLISRATEADTSRFVHTERKWAAEKAVQGEIFYIPIVIDDVPSVAAEPEVFRRIHRHKLQNGEISAEFAALIQRYIEEYNQNGEVRDV